MKYDMRWYDFNMIYMTGRDGKWQILMASQSTRWSLQASVCVLICISVCVSILPWALWFSRYIRVWVLACSVPLPLVRDCVSTSPFLPSLILWSVYPRALVIKFIKRTQRNQTESNATSILKIQSRTPHPPLPSLPSFLPPLWSLSLPQFGPPCLPPSLLSPLPPVPPTESIYQKSTFRNLGRDLRLTDNFQLPMFLRTGRQWGRKALGL